MAKVMTLTGEAGDCAYFVSSREYGYQTSLLSLDMLRIFSARIWSSIVIFLLLLGTIFVTHMSTTQA